MMKVSFVSALVLLVFIGLSCGKDGGTPPPPPDTPGTINITSPTATIIYLNGDNLKVEGEMTDINVLSSARVEIKNQAGSVLFAQTTSTGNVTFFRFLWNWTITGITGPTVLTVKVTAKDKQSNEVSSQLNINVDI